MEEQFSVEYCCGIRTFYHTWNLLLLVLTINKVYMKTQTLIFYGHFLQPVSIISFAFCNILYMVSLCVRNKARAVSAVAYAWCLSLMLIFPAALLDRVLIYVDPEIVCKGFDDC